MTKCPSDDIAYLKFVFLLVKFDIRDALFLFAHLFCS